MQSLHFPEYCPHGHPICPVDPRRLRPLDTVEADEEVAIAQISEVREELLAYFDQVGMQPGTVIKVSEVSPLGGPLTLHTEHGTVSLGKEVAALIQVCDPAEADWMDRHSA